MEAYHRRIALVALAVMLQLWTGGAVTIAQQPSSNRAAEVGARDVLQQYSTAFASLDAIAVKKLHPSIDLENLKKAFGEMHALDVRIEDIRVLSTDGAIARVSCRVTQTLTSRASVKQSTSITRVMRLRKQSASWVIESFER